MVEYTELIDLASSRKIKVIEASGLNERTGMRFKNAGKDFIALNSAVPTNEKMRALGFLLENYESRGVTSIRCPG